MISRHSKLPVHALERIDDACEQFEQSWQDGTPGRIETFLTRATEASERSALLAELLSLEVDYLRRRGEQPDVEEYVSRFSDNEESVRRVFAELIDEATTEASRQSSSSSSSFGAADSNSALCFSQGRYVALEKLGVGGFATVYRAFDQSLQRDVAIKVPHAHRVNDLDLDAYLNEARLVAKLDHPAIVPVFDTGRSSDGACYVVSKLIKGQDLAQLMRQRRPSSEESVAIVTQVADALAYAHQRGLVHRDLKPANILLDVKRKAYVTDFGLAMETDAPRDHNAFVGTPAYMSPEQAANEAHLIDHRTDIFSLGVILYEMLAGCRPFSGTTMREVLEAIREGSCASPIHHVADLSPQLDRICMRAIAPRISDRYDSVDALRRELAAASDSKVVASERPTAHAANITTRKCVVIPRGLRSFDETDSDAFIELLPGPFDQSGLPTSLAFWLKRISPDASNPFRIGLLSGPSGSGKSSLVKAGLIPRLHNGVKTLFIEASAEHTEATLLETIHRQIPNLKANNLVEAFAALRRLEHLKHCVFIDQFEQWLQRNKVESSQLVAAFRHCDGDHLQCVLMVRDEFGMMAARLLYELDIPVEQGNNFAAVSTLPAKRARQTLTKFGRALDQFPDKEQEPSPNQDSFLDAAIESISENGRVVPVQLALFTEIMRDRPWNPESLAVTGRHGLGHAFLEQNFGENSLHPECRLHRTAARHVLKALLPARSIEIKGSVKNREELLIASGYEKQPEKFDALMRLLDRELRLITPTEVIRDDVPEHSSTDEIITEETGYLLAHDFMVAPLREWLTQKHKQTLRGRAELCLAERASWWADSKANQQLPSLGEWLSIRSFVRARHWSNSEREMMQAASKQYLGQLALVGFLMALAFFGWNNWTFQREAESLTDRIVNARQSNLPQLVHHATLSSSRIEKRLRAKARDQSLSPEQQLNALVALSRREGKLLPGLIDRLMTAKADTFAAACRCLAPLSTKLLPELEAIKIEESDAQPERRFRIACLIAQIDSSRIPDNEVSDITDQLIRRNLLELRVWAELVQPLRDRLSERLRVYFHDPSDSETQCVATTILAQIHQDDLQTLLDLIASANGNQLAALTSVLRDHQVETLPTLRQLWAESFNPPRESLKSVPLSTSRLLEDAGGLVAPRHAFAIHLEKVAFATANAQLTAAGFELDQSIEHTVETAAGFELEQSIEHTVEEDLRHSAIWRRGRDASHHGSTANDAARAKEQTLLPLDGQGGVRQLLYVESNSVFAAQQQYYSVDMRYLGGEQALGKPDVRWTRQSYFDSTTMPCLQVVTKSANMAVPALRFDECDSFTIEALILGWSGPILQQNVGKSSLWMSLNGGKNANIDCGWTTAVGRPACELSFATDKLTGWNHIAIVVHNERATCYVNGESIGSRPVKARVKLPRDATSGELKLYRSNSNSNSKRSTQNGVGKLAAVRISNRARYVDEFEPKQRLVFDDETLFSLNVTHSKLPITELADRYDRIADVTPRDRRPGMVRHLFVNGFGTEEHERLSSAIKSGLFQPVWFRRQPTGATGVPPACWQSRWTRIEDTPVNGRTANRIANLAVALWDLGELQAVAPAFALRQNNELRSQLITRLAAANCDPRSMLKQIRAETAPGIRQALILALGEFGAQAISTRTRKDYVDGLVAIYQQDRNAGVHAAIEFVFRRWREPLPPPTLTNQPERTADNPTAVRHADWILGPRGHQLAVIETPNPLPSQRQDRENYAAKYAIGLRPVSHEEFGEFAELEGLHRPDASPQRPARSVTYYDAAAYCNWLSEQANISRHQWCFAESKSNDGKLEAVQDYLLKRGFRIPTVAEWRMACGGGVSTRFPWGESDVLSDQYAWVSSNSRLAKTDIGLKKPNWCGLFDITGNVSEWTRHNDGQWHKTKGYVCGAHRHEQRWLHHIAAFRYLPKATSDFTIGFRVAQTLE